jgi:hypothetical protein
VTEPLAVVAARINEGAAHFAAGRYEEALAAYAGAFDPLPSGVSFVVPPKLRAMIDARKLDVLVAMKRWTEARALLDAMPGAEAHLDDAQLYSFALARARVIGQDRTIDDLLQAFSDAMRIADERLRDREKVLMVEYEMLGCLRRREAWKPLVDTARALVAMGQDRQDNVMVMCASRWIPYAHRGLGDAASARKLAEQILDWARRNAVEEDVREWESFLASLEK